MTQIEESIVNGTCSLKDKEIELDENEDECTDYFPDDNGNDLELNKENVEYVPRIKWPDLAAQTFIHFGCVYGFYLCLTQAKALTSLWGKNYNNYRLLFTDHYENRLASKNDLMKLIM